MHYYNKRFMGCDREEKRKAVAKLKRCLGKAFTEHFVLHGFDILENVLTIRLEKLSTLNSLYFVRSPKS